MTNTMSTKKSPRVNSDYFNSPEYNNIFHSKKGQVLDMEFTRLREKVTNWLNKKWNDKIHKPSHKYYNLFARAVKDSANISNVIVGYDEPTTSHYITFVSFDHKHYYDDGRVMINSREIASYNMQTRRLTIRRKGAPNVTKVIDFQREPSPEKVYKYALKYGNI